MQLYNVTPSNPKLPAKPAFVTPPARPVQPQNSLPQAAVRFGIFGGNSDSPEKRWSLLGLIRKIFNWKLTSTHQQVDEARFKDPNYVKGRIRQERQQAQAEFDSAIASLNEIIVEYQAAVEDYERKLAREDQEAEDVAAYMEDLEKMKETDEGYTEMNELLEKETHEYEEAKAEREAAERLMKNLAERKAEVDAKKLAAREKLRKVNEELRDAEVDNIEATADEKILTIDKRLQQFDEEGIGVSSDFGEMREALRKRRIRNRVQLQEGDNRGGLSANARLLELRRKEEARRKKTWETARALLEKKRAAVQTTAQVETATAEGGASANPLDQDLSPQQSRRPKK